MTDVLVFVQDPGAANFVVDLPGELRRRGRSCELAVAGAAVSYLNVHDRVIDGTEPDGLLDGTRPHVVVVGTSEDPDTFALPLLTAARRRGIPTIGVVDGPDNAGRRFRGRSDDPLAHAPDTVLVPDADTARSFEEAGFAADAVLVTGHPHHDAVRAAAGRPTPRFPWSDAGVPVLLFAAEPSTGLDPAWFLRSDEFTLTGRGSSVKRTDIVLEEFLDAVAPFEVCTVLRLHPKSAASDFDAYLGEFDHVSGEGSSLNLLPSVDGVVGLTSMLLEEAVLLGVPTLSIVPRPHERALSTPVRLGLTPCVWTRDAVRDAVAALVEAPRPAPRQAVEAAYPTGALDRVVRAIEARLGG